MQIKSLQLNNFKCFENRLFNFTSRIEITGRNGSGKSTIAEAIVFTLYNRTLNGSKDTDTYIMKGMDMCEATLITDKGILRRRRGKQSRAWLNDVEITQENIEKELNLPDFEIFNSVFSTGYFMVLDESMQRQIILDLTEKVDMIKLFKKLGGTDDQINKWHIDFDDLDSSYKEINKQKLVCQKSIDSIVVGIDTYVNELSSISIKDLEVLEKHKEEIEKKLETNVKDIELFQNHLREKQRYNDFASLIKEKKNLEEWLKKNPIKAVPEIKSLIEEKDKLLRQCVDIDLSGELKCPTCKQKISVKYKKEIEEFSNLTDKRVEQIDKTIGEIRGLDSYNSLVCAKQEKFDSIVIPIDIVEPQQVLVNNEDYLVLDGATMRNELKRTEADINEISYQIKRKSSLELKIDENKKSVIELEKNLIELKNLVEILSPKGLSNEEMNIKLNSLKDRLQKEIEGVDIHLLELLKSEMGYRKIFKISVNGIEYKRLSCGEKKKIDVFLSTVLNAMLKERFNNAINIFFIDGMEALSQTINFSDNLVQIFLSEVSENELAIKTL